MSVATWMNTAVAAPTGDGSLPVRNTREHRAYLASLVPMSLRSADIAEVTPDDVVAAMEEMLATPTGKGRSRSVDTVRRVRTFLANAFDLAVDAGTITSNPVRQTRPPGKQKVASQPLLDVVQARRLLGELNGHPWLLLYMLMAVVGLKRGEALGLKWENVDENTGTIRVGSTIVHTVGGARVEKEPATPDGWRIVPLPPYVLRLMANHRRLHGDNRTYVFAGETGRTPHPTSLKKPLAAASKRAGIAPAATPSSLRASAASVALAAGASEHEVNGLLGYTDPRMVVRHRARGSVGDISAHLDAAWSA